MILSEIIQIPTDRIHANPDNPRIEVGDVTELAAQIDQVGLLEALIVSPLPRYGPDHYEIMAGERRWTACRFLKFEEIDCRVVTLEDGSNKGLASLLVGVMENHRENLSAIERARAYARIRDEYEFKTIAAISRATGINQASIGNDLLLLELDAPSQKRVLAGKVSIGDARDAVRKHRQKNRKKAGHQPVNVGWDPPFFTKNHALAGKAKVMCEERGHNSRRKLHDSGACEWCWEAIIRVDQTIVIKASTDSLGMPFIPSPDRLRPPNGQDAPAVMDVPPAGVIPFSSKSYDSSRGA